MLRKTVSQRLKSIANRRCFLQVAGQDLGHRLAGRPAAPRDASFSYQPLFEHWLAELALVERRLATEERAYYHAKSRLADRRQKRNQAAAALHDRQAPIRRLVDALHDDLLQTGGITGAPPSDPIDLAREVQLMLSLLKDLDGSPQAPLVDLEIKLPALAAGLEAGVRELQAACSALAVEHPATTDARYRADQAATEAALVDSAIARSLDGLCRLAGLPNQLPGR